MHTVLRIPSYGQTEKIFGPFRSFQLQAEAVAVVSSFRGTSRQ
jgi:hypothetical protein